MNPFDRPQISPGAQVVDTAGRLDAVRRFSVAQCAAGLQVPGLQPTVAQAIHRRVRQLERQAGDK